MILVAGADEPEEEPESLPVEDGRRRVPSLGREQLVDGQAMARADVYWKLQRLWDFCEADLDPGRLKPDMRKAQLALRIAQEMSRVFMLDQLLEPAAPPEAPEVVRARDVESIEAGLRELETRMQAS